PPSVLQNNQARNKFSVKIGIVSHFLCDFFCLPHYNRWHYNSSMMLPHIKFEKSLNQAAKNIDAIPTLFLQPISNLDKDTLESFIETVLREYSLNEDYCNDLHYASNICAEIIEKITTFIFTAKKAQTYAQIA
ncbi:MAG TPA: zinc dependent phospholipase C family protein, partial [Desulfitobacteriaceae bacterium]|nr:zinc dependent phospholipase C family protein [Desulfitobacteriaceae bacterium]